MSVPTQSPMSLSMALNETNSKNSSLQWSSSHTMSTQESLVQTQIETRTYTDKNKTLNVGQYQLLVRGEEPALNTTMTYYPLIKLLHENMLAIRYLFTHPADSEQHQHLCGVMFLFSCKMSNVQLSFQLCFGLHKPLRKMSVSLAANASPASS